jgi:hypothetical protein
MLQHTTTSIPIIEPHCKAPFFHQGQLTSVVTSALTSPPRLAPPAALAFWNLFLSLFSAIGAVRILSHFIYLVLPAPYGGGFTVRDTLCAHPEGVYADGATGLWAFLFTFSKCIELIDTVFVVRCRPATTSHTHTDTHTHTPVTPQS